MDNPQWAIKRENLISTLHPPTQNDLIALFGISGSFKKTLGKQLAQRLGYHFFDLDWFYKKEKPTVRLSNGKLKEDWDTLAALDLDEFRRHLRLIKGGVVVVGFALRDDIFEKQPRITVHLRTGRDAETIIQRAIAARRESKGFAGVKAKDDELMVREYVYPFFVSNLGRINVTANLDVYETNYYDEPDGFKRRPINELLDTLVEYVDAEDFSMTP
jgi:hypothetical protein